MQELDLMKQKLSNVFGAIDILDLEPTSEGRYIKVTLKVRGVTLTQYWVREPSYTTQIRNLTIKMAEYLLC